ncbi:MAG: integrase [Thermodesulfobacteriota bacterium]|nr:MAG: integrase [Thermodesulfobacteriota bacterium]
MGCYKKGNRWYIDYYDNGSRKREVVTIKGKDPSTITYRDAENALAIRKAEIAQGKFDISKTEKPIKFEKLIDAYIDWANENHKSPDRDHTIRNNLLDFYKGKNIYSLTLWDIEKYKSDRKKRGRKPETINKELGALRRMFNLALQGALKIKIGKNPIKGIKLLKVPKIKPKTYRPKEFQKLYDCAPKHFKPILLCAYMTGMRRSEIATLKWPDVDFQARTIYIAETKNDEPRLMPLSEALYSVLQDLKNNSESEFVFTTHEGKPYTSRSSWKSTWATTLKKSEIEKGRFHDLRHTFVSNLIVNEKEDFATVMALSGHKDISMLKRYSHTHDEAKRNAISKLNQTIIVDNQPTSQ